MSHFTPALRYRSDRVILWFAAVCLVALVLLGGIDRLAGAGLDATILIGLRRAVDHDGAGWSTLHALMMTAAALGALPTLLLAIAAGAGYLIGSGARRQALIVVATTLSGIGMANLLKLAVLRPRPLVVAHWATVGGWSFPSGHAADSAITWLMLAQIAAVAAPGAMTERLLIGGALLLVIAIGLSRVYLGVHWPSDVLAGWVLGSGWAWFCATRLLTKGGRTRAG